MERDNSPTKKIPLYNGKLIFDIMIKLLFSGLKVTGFNSNKIFLLTVKIE